MLVTNHVLSGAVVGAAARRPVPAFVAGVASHFVLDAIPHWGQWDDDRRFFRIAVVDGLTGLAAMAAFAKLARDAGPRRLTSSVVAGMVGAALPDLDKPAFMLFGLKLWPAAVNRFHRRIQDEAQHRFFTHEVAGGTVFALTAVTLIRRIAR